jgi:hypothetical protein
MLNLILNGVTTRGKPLNPNGITEGKTLKGFAEKLKHELLEMVPPAIFFLIAFHILALSRTLMLKDYGVTISAVAGVTIGALLVAKAIVLADLLPFVNRFPDKPLIYNVLWKTMIYVIAALIVHGLERFIPFWWHTGNFGTAIHRFYAEEVWPDFWDLQMWLFVLLFVYCVCHEWVRVIGVSEVMRIFFGARRKSDSRRERPV